MKLLSIAVPCYNSQEYMRKCIDSLLVGGEHVEILIVNDGSKDETAQIANEYAENYPSIVRAIHQENSGHGGAVNTGIKNATGIYFKVVDSDDWVDENAYHTILETLKKMTDENKLTDVLVSNYVYEKLGAKCKKIMQYRNSLPQNKLITWDEVGKLKNGQYILMHSVIYLTKLLIESGLELPKHTFYVDNLYVYVPMRHVKTLYYLDVDFYRYFIGRADQSVNENIMIKRIDQQIKVNKLMLTAIDLYQVKNVKQRSYLLSYLDIVTSISSIMLLRSNTPEHLEKKEELWTTIKEYNPKVYTKLRYSLLGVLCNLRGKSGRNISVFFYRIAQKMVGFN